ncbi:tRNA (adenosine(37)-N6)-dimethylallyltransferase MiaA [Mesonia sp. HuA40]|uniref:tRNA (adenosine(37)-N6)-dimethylallyltransferase MiaA n=1 Tax=Mesonia sp. HuA40 TaxID=2602761 RepID=UPI0011C7E779|nr:tRNA (adenosine(37)-N6)-dimethylallyltransferase MiaA [Mesonia sp. HuA40]TXK74323.1 tRNA (adenosine(37)-N6)-dimethylallyltransferase MiaA [Mesonia sp. HuA40]
MNNLIHILGPTAIGKTALAIKVAQHFNTEIISADSRQFYKEMNIGTAVPSLSELKAAKHHYIQNKSIHQEFSVGDFEKEVIPLIDKLFQDKNPLVMVGGSGLYIKAITDGLDQFPNIDPHIRENLNQRYAEEGLEKLAEELRELDPKYAAKADLQNKQRVIRALEICLGAPHNFSFYRTQNKKERNFKNIKIGLEANRAILYERIEKRVDLMLEMGLLKEAKNLYAHRNLNALNTVGYKELFAYFDGKCSLDFAVAEIKKHTRRFAKRQMTWFKKDPEIKWFDYTQDTKTIIHYIEQKTLAK